MSMPARLSIALACLLAWPAVATADEPAPVKPDTMRDMRATADGEPAMKPPAEPVSPPESRDGPTGGGGAKLSAAHEARLDAMAARIDGLLEDAWAAQGIEPSAPIDDARFLRRVSLDLIGRIPRAAEARAFLADASPDRRRQLVERLLGSRQHAEYMASIWHAALLPDVGGSTPLEPWLADRFAASAGYDRIARDIVRLAAKGNGGDAGLVQALDRKPTELAAAVSRTFLGTQIQCAECHKHPTDVWTQDDFWGFAAFFGSVKQPKTEAEVAPRFLGDGAAVEPDRGARGQLADWLASPQNRWFARAAVNRLWGLLFGAGIVDPVDDLGDHNPPVHAGVLDELAGFFAAGGWSHRDVLRVLTRTRAYGLAGGERRLFAAMPLEPLNAVQLYNSLATAYRAPRLGAAGRGVPGAFRGDTPVEQFLAKFRAAAGQDREYNAGIPQAITMMNGQMFDPMRAVYDEAMLAARDDTQRVEALFMATVSRPPAGAELEQCLEVLGRETTAAGRRLAFIDIHWALVNSAEFAFSP